jgi:hypothetical protein
MKSRILTIIAALALFAVPAAAQFSNTNATAGTGCGAAPAIGIDTAGNIYGCGLNTTRLWQGLPNGTAVFTNKTFDTAATGNVFKSNGTPLVSVTGMLSNYQGTTATSITTGNFTPLTGPTTQKIPAGTAGANLAGKTVVVRYGGVYTTGAASLLNTEVSLCTVAGCGSGTVVSPVGCVVTTTNQANVLANGQFDATCTFIVATTGAAATLMAKSTAAVNLGAATSAVLSVFGDLATALSAAVDLTVDEFVQPQFKFTTSNAGNAATLQYMTISIS